MARLSFSATKHIAALGIVPVAGLLLSACVSQSAYDELQAQHQQLEEQNRQLQGQLATVQAQASFVEAGDFLFPAGGYHAQRRRQGRVGEQYCSKAQGPAVLQGCGLRLYR